MSHSSTTSRTSTGAVFRQAREARGESLEAVHEATKIPLDVLKAIEEEYTVRTLSPFYLKAFKKKYAEYLKLDPQQVVEDYRKERLPGRIHRESAEDTLDRWVVVLEGFFTKERQKKIAKAVAVLVGVFVMIRLGGCVASFWHKRSSAHRQTVVQKAKGNEQKRAGRQKKSSSQARRGEKKTGEKAKEKAKENHRPAPAVQSTGAKKPATPVAVETTRNVTVTVRPRKRSWLQVKQDGNVVFQSILEKGATETWVADEKVEISGRNIYWLEFEINGKWVGSLGRGDREARRVIITQKGLKVLE